MLVAAQDAGIKPVALSAGVDGWAGISFLGRVARSNRSNRSSFCCFPLYNTTSARSLSLCKSKCHHKNLITDNAFVSKCYHGITP